MAHQPVVVVPIALGRPIPFIPVQFPPIQPHHPPPKTICQGPGDWACSIALCSISPSANGFEWMCSKLKVKQIVFMGLCINLHIKSLICNFFQCPNFQFCRIGRRTSPRFGNSAILQIDIDPRQKATTTKCDKKGQRCGVQSGKLNSLLLNVFYIFILINLILWPQLCIKNGRGIHFLVN